jgi:hypothetical protein
MAHERERGKAVDAVAGDDGAVPGVTAVVGAKPFVARDSVTKKSVTKKYRKTTFSPWSLSRLSRVSHGAVCVSRPADARLSSRETQRVSCS